MSNVYPKKTLEVTCICPTTASHHGLISVAINSFLSQKYTESELLIVDDAHEPLKLEPHPRIRYVHLDGVYDIGTKRNLCVDMARAHIICHWDSDDWSAPTRIDHQLRTLHHYRPMVTGYHGLSFWDMRSRRAYRIVAGATAEGESTLPYAMGTSLCYQKAFWEENPFPAVSIGEDIWFNDRAKELRQLNSENGIDQMVVRRHASNISHDSAVGRTIHVGQLPQGFPYEH